MMRKRSLFNYYLRRYWWILLLSAVTCICSICAPAISGVDSVNLVPDSGALIESLLQELCDRLAYYATITAGALSAVACFAATSYLSGRKNADFYHSQPIRREKLFLVRLGAVSVYAIGALALASVFALAVLASNGLAIGFGSYLRFFIPPVIMYLLIASLVCLSASLTGQLPVSILAFIFFAAVIPVTRDLVIEFMSRLFSSFPAAYWTTVFVDANPLFWPLPDAGLTIRPIAAVCALVLSAALLSLSVVLVKKRRAELSGESVVYPRIRPFVKFVIITLGALGAGILGSFSGGFGLMIFCMLAMIVVLHMLLEAIFERSIKKILSHFKQLVVYLCAFAAVFACAVFDPFGYDAYIPDAGSIKKVYCTFSYYDENSSSVSFVDNSSGYLCRYVFREQENIKNLVELCRTLQEDTRSLTRSQLYSPRYSADRLYPQNTYHMCFELQNGSRIVRTFSSTEALLPEQSADLYYTLRASDEYKRNDQILSNGRDISGIMLSDRSGIYDYEPLDISDRSVISMLSDAYEADLHMPGETLATLEVSYDSGSPISGGTRIFSVYADDSHTLDAIEKLTGIRPCTTSDYILEHIDDFSVSVSGRSDERPVAVSSQADKLELLQKGLLIGRSVSFSPSAEAYPLEQEDSDHAVAWADFRTVINGRTVTATYRYMDFNLPDCIHKYIEA